LIGFYFNAVRAGWGKAVIKKAKGTRQKAKGVRLKSEVGGRRSEAEGEALKTQRGYILRRSLFAFHYHIIKLSH
jgi:hypothetical protein